MPYTVTSPTKRIPIEPLTPSIFSPFGTVIENPSRSHPNATATLNAVVANQGTALKFTDVTSLKNHYTLAPSKKPAEPKLNMFVCSPRKLRSASGDVTGEDYIDDYIGDEAAPQLFDLKILERHPYTSQTFIPLGLSATEKTTRYLVIVAPTLPVARSRRDLKDRQPPYPADKPKRRRSIKDVFSKARPSPYTVEAAPSGKAAFKTNSTANSTPHITPPPTDRPKGPGLPDLSQVRAFLANGSQAVTYGAGTWHAPMVVLGQRAVDFVVVQYANGVDGEDCQEVVLQPDGAGKEGVTVTVGESISDGTLPSLLESKAKL